MKKTFLLFCLVSIGLLSSAQTTTTTTVTTTKTVVTTYNDQPRELRPIGSELSIGLETGLAVGNLRDYSSFGVGGTAKYAYNFNESIAATFQTGYIDFISKNVVNPNPNNGTGKINTSQIPLKVGVRYGIGRFYMEPQLGMSILREKWVDGGVSNSSTAFTYAGNIGVLATRNFDLSVRYEGISKKSGSIGYLGLRLAYAFPL